LGGGWEWQCGDMSEECGVCLCWEGRRRKDIMRRSCGKCNIFGRWGRRSCLQL